MSNNWRYNIDIRPMLDDETTNPSALLNRLIKELGKLLVLLDKDVMVDASSKYVLREGLVDSKQNFELLLSFINGAISEDVWADYDYDGDHITNIDNHLDDLCDIFNERIELNNGTTEQFVWIN
jgi:hypothetical protein